MEIVEHFGRMLKSKEPKYRIVRVYRNTGKKLTLQRNLTLEEAKRLVNSFPSCLNSMVVFYKQ